MKKKLLGMFLISTLIFTSCSGKTKYEDEIISSIASENETGTVQNDIENSDINWNISFLSSVRSKWNFTITPRGYYYSDVSGNSHKYKEYHISPYYFYDTNKEATTILCSKLNCDHKNPTECEAYFGNIILSLPQPDNSVVDNYYTSGFQYYKQRLWMLEYDVNNGTRLVSYDKAGYDKNIELTVEKNPTYVPDISSMNMQFMLFNDKLYVQLMSRGTKETRIKFEILEVDIISKKKNVLLEWDIASDIFESSDYISKGITEGIMGIDKDSPYFVRQLWDGDNSVLELLKLNDGKLETVYNDIQYLSDKSYNSAACMYLKDNKIYYINFSDDGSNGKLVIFDVSTKETQTINIDNLYMWSMYDFIDDEYIYIYTEKQTNPAQRPQPNISIYKQSDLSCIYSYDLQPGNGRGEMVLVDDKNLMIYEQSAKENSTNKFVMKILDKSLIGSGNEKWKELD